MMEPDQPPATILDLLQTQTSLRNALLRWVAKLDDLDGTP